MQRHTINLKQHLIDTAVQTDGIAGGWSKVESPEITSEIEIFCTSISYGVFRMTDLEECANAVVQAVKSDHCLPGTAAAYENELTVLPHIDG